MLFCYLSGELWVSLGPVGKQEEGCVGLRMSKGLKQGLGGGRVRTVVEGESDTTTLGTPKHRGAEQSQIRSSRANCNTDDESEPR